MFKLEIKLDEAKIVDEGMYNLQKLYQRLELLLDEHKIEGKQLSNGTFVYFGFADRCYSIFAYIIVSLKRCEWFINNVEKWKWYNDDGLGYFTNYEDLLYHYTKVQRRKI